MTEGEIYRYIKELSVRKMEVNRWIYRTTCVGCKHHVDFRMSGKTYKYCADMQCYVNNPEQLCQVCDFNKANPSRWWILKYRIREFFKRKINHGNKYISKA